MNIFLDDIRPAPEDYILVRSGREFVELVLKNKYNINIVSLDHDLGNNITGYDVAKWIVINDIWPNKIIIHTQNPVGKENMYKLLERYKPDCVELVKGGVKYMDKKCPPNTDCTLNAIFNQKLINKDLIDNFVKIGIPLLNPDGSYRHLSDIINDLEHIWDKIE